MEATKHGSVLDQAVEFFQKPFAFESLAEESHRRSIRNKA